MPNPKPTDTQLIILSSASQREDGLAVLPEKLKGGAAKKVVSKLLDQGLLKEVRVKRNEPHWRVDENEHPIGLKLTRSGQRAIQVEEGAGGRRGAGPEGLEASREAARAGSEGKAASEAGPREGSKKAHVLSLLSRPQGATIDDLLRATGWLPHTTRAALTGLRKEGYEFVKRVLSPPFIAALLVIWFLLRGTSIQIQEKEHLGNRFCCGNFYRSLDGSILVMRSIFLQTVCDSSVGPPAVAPILVWQTSCAARVGARCDVTIINGQQHDEPPRSGPV